MPKLMNNHGNFIGSLGNVVRFLAARSGRRSASRSIPASPAPKCSTATRAKCVGVATGDMGVGRDGTPKDSFTRGMELRGKYTLFAEGARGSLTKQLAGEIRSLQRQRAAEIRHRLQGAVAHSEGEAQAGPRAAFLRLAACRPTRAAAPSSIISTTDLVSIGFVVHLNYSNPTLSPFDEFQRFKTHPMIAPTLEGGERLSYGARALTEGGWQSVPKLVFPGGALVGCAAGFMNVPRIKGLAQRRALGHSRRRACRGGDRRKAARMTR